MGTPARAYKRSPSSRLEQIMLIATIVMMPLQDHLPSIGGFSVMYLAFATLAAYIGINRPAILLRTTVHPCFVSGYGLIALAILVESQHPFSNFKEISRIGLMIVGAVLVACLARDRNALRSALFAYIAAGVWISIMLIMTSYGSLQVADATDFGTASEVRGEIFQDQTLKINLNTMAFFAGQSTVVALVFVLFSSGLRRLFVILLAMICLLGTFLPMSRGGIAIVLLSSGMVLLAHGSFRKIFALSLLLALFVIALVPDAVVARLTFSTETRGGKLEGRAYVLNAVMQHFPEYVISGVGAGNFWGPWGRRSGFVKSGKVRGAHNGFFQATIYWGVLGLIALVLLLSQAYRCIPIHSKREPLSLALLGIAVGLFLLLGVSHSLYDKQLSLGFGLLVASRLWIWPRGIVESRSTLICHSNKSVTSDEYSRKVLCA